MDNIIKVITDNIKLLTDKLEFADEIIYPNTFIPIYQVLSAFFWGLLFGPYHQAFIWSLVFYFGFEYIIRLAMKRRSHLYCIRYRVLAIIFSLVGVIFSKYIWKERSSKSTIFNFFNIRE